MKAAAGSARRNPRNRLLRCRRTEQSVGRGVTPARRVAPQHRPGNDQPDVRSLVGQRSGSSVVTNLVQHEVARARRPRRPPPLSRSLR